MAIPRCALCRQPIFTERLGVRLTPLKAGILDAIKRAGELGITSVEIVGGPVFADRERPNSDSIKSHVWQINDQLDGTPWIIVSDRRRWFLQRRKVRRVA
jgi:hypothetical protein